MKVTVLADPRSNSLMVTGPQEGFDVVKSVAEQLDAAKVAFGGEVQLVPLKFANAGTVARRSPALRPALPGRRDARHAAAEAHHPARPADQQPHGRGHADDHKILEGLLAHVDRELTEPTVKIDVIPLKNNDAAVVAP